MKASPKRAPDSRPRHWWARRRNRMNIWTGVLLVVLIGAVGVFWASTRRSSSSLSPSAAGAVPVGQKVDPVKLEDSRTGGTFDLGEYVGKKDIVLVAYMGDF